MIDYISYIFMLVAIILVIILAFKEYKETQRNIYKYKGNDYYKRGEVMVKDIESGNWYLAVLYSPYSNLETNYVREAKDFYNKFQGKN